MYKMLIITFTAFIYCTAPLYLCKLIEQQNTTTNTRLGASAAFLLKLLVEIVLKLFERSFFMGHHMNGTRSMNVSGG